MIYWELFLGFLKVGCFAFGGAYGAIPFIRSVVLSYGWLSDEALTDMIAVSESTPGPIMVNLATYVGSSQAGLPGAVLATLAVTLPAFGIILALMAILKKVTGNRAVQAAMQGIKPCIIGVILETGVYMLADNCAPIWNGGAVQPQALAVLGILLAAALGFRLICKKKLPPTALIAVAALVGILLY